MSTARTLNRERKRFGNATERPTPGPGAPGKRTRVAARYGAVQRKVMPLGPDEAAPEVEESWCADPAAPEAASDGSWRPSDDPRRDGHDLLAGRGSPAAISSSTEEWCEKIANRLQLAFDALIRGVSAAERELREPAGRTPPDDWVMDMVLNLALLGVTGPASAIIGRFVTQAITSGVLTETIKIGIRTAMGRSIEKGVAAVASPSKDRDPAEKSAVAKNQMMGRFMLRQELALQRAKGDAFDHFIDEVRPALVAAPEPYLRALHEQLSDLSASEELAYAQAARSIAAWTTYLSYWTHGSFGSQVDFYKGMGSGYWRKRYTEGVVQIELKPMKVPDTVFVGPLHGVIEGTPVEVESMQIGGISDSAKAVLRENMQFIGDLRGIPMFVSFQAHMLPAQKSIIWGIGPRRQELRTFTIELARQPDGSVMLSRFHAEHEDQWLSAYYDAIFGGGSAEEGARDIFDQLDRVPLPAFR